MVANQPTVVSFKQSYPIDFSLTNINNESLLYIDDIGETAYLKITNTSGAPITIPVGGQKPPFDLRFRPGTLAEPRASAPGAQGTVTDITLGQSDGWIMTQVKGSDGIVSLILKNGKNAVSLNPGESLSFTLNNVRASASSGSHGTRVELRYQNLQSGNSNVEGVREKHLSILNHAGRKHIPLYVDLVDSHKVLNDGTTPNELRLRITNTMKEDPEHKEQSRITLRGKEDSIPSRLIFSFVVGTPNMDWALGTPDQVGDIITHGNEPGAVRRGLVAASVPSSRMRATAGVRVAASGIPGEVVGNQVYRSQEETGWITKVEKLGEAPEWELMPATTIELKAQEYIEFTFSNIITGHPNGYTNLYVQYKNIPGYWDGRFAIPIEKTPIVIKDNRVGIGKKDPAAELDVAGTVQAQSFSGDGIVPIGVIVMWHGGENDIPAGWKLCNGENGTPNLRDRFIVGAGSAYPAGNTGGADQVTLTDAQMPSHTHPATTNSDGNHEHSLGARMIASYLGIEAGKSPGADGSHDDRDILTNPGDGRHDHGISVANAGGNQPHENRPPFYALCFIMKVSS